MVSGLRDDSARVQARKRPSFSAGFKRYHRTCPQRDPDCASKTCTATIRSFGAIRYSARQHLRIISSPAIQDGVMRHKIQSLNQGVCLSPRRRHLETSHQKVRGVAGRKEVPGGCPDERLEKRQELNIFLLVRLPTAPALYSCFLSFLPLPACMRYPRVVARWVDAFPTFLLHHASHVPSRNAEVLGLKALDLVR